MFLLDRLDFRLPNHANKGSLKKYEKRTGAVYNGCAADFAPENGICRVENTRLWMA